MMLKFSRTAAFAPSWTASCTTVPLDWLEWRTIDVPAAAEVVAVIAQLAIDRGNPILGNPNAPSVSALTPGLPERITGVAALYCTFAKNTWVWS